MDTFKAVMICEGEEDSTGSEFLEAWASLIKTGVVWQLQGWYGRGAKAFIEKGLIDLEGNIDWERYEELRENWQMEEEF